MFGSIQAGIERAALKCLYLQQGLPYNHVIRMGNDVFVDSVLIVPFISLAHWKLSILKSGMQLLFFCLKYSQPVKSPHNYMMVKDV